MKEIQSASLQLLTQGTADLVLDCCDDFWDGKDLRPLGAQERKRAQDFYQRSALTAYCTAFAYRPLRHGIGGALAGKSGETAYLELPPESKYKMEHAQKSHCDFQGHRKLHHSLSTDSLLFTDNKEDDIADVEGCFEMECHQVFIGMGKNLFFFLCFSILIFPKSCGLIKTFGLCSYGSRLFSFL